MKNFVLHSVQHFAKATENQIFDVQEDNLDMLLEEYELEELEDNFEII